MQEQKCSRRVTLLAMVMVLMLQQGISLEDIHKELAGRHVIDKKVKQEKMT